MWSLQLIGPVRLQRNGRDLHLGSRKALVLLTRLALDGPRTRETLAVQLWPQQDPAAARRNLRRELFRLRAFGLALEQSDSATIGLPPDVTVVSEGAGLPLDGLQGAVDTDFDDWLQARGASLLQHRRDRLLAAPDLASWLAALDQDPCDEALLRRVMEHLAEQDQAAQALALYRRSVDALRTQLDQAPGALIQALAESLRRPAVAAPSLLAERLPFVPRPALMAQIDAAWSAGRTVWLSGPPGSGKTRMASECAAARGPWLRVACAPSDAGLPYASALRTLRQLLEAAADEPLPTWVQRELAQLMPEFGEPPVARATADARTRLLAALSEALRLLLRDNFNVLVLDDWQWADEASIELLHALDAAALPQLLRLVSYRSANLPPAALATMRRAVDAAQAVRVELGGFDADETLDLVHMLSASPGGSLFARRLQQATDGNPFFLIETLRYLHAQGLLQIDALGRWSTPFDAATVDYAELPVPASVREAVNARVHALGDAARPVLEAASLLDGPVDPGLLATLTGCPIAAVLAQGAHAQAARLLVAGEHGWQFAHDLVRQCLSESMPAARRCQWHGDIALVLATAQVAPDRVAQHFELAAQPRAAVPWRQRAGDAAWRVHALAEARAQWQQALADGPGPEDAITAWLSLAGLHRRQADREAQWAAVSEALGVAEHASPAARLEARLACAEFWVQGDRVDDASALLASLQPALTRGTPSQQARALELQALMASWAGRLDEAREQRDRAIALLEGHDDTRVQLGQMLDSAARRALSSGAPTMTDALARRAVAAFEAAGDTAGLAEALVIGGIALLHGQGDAPAAQKHFERARLLSARCGLVPTQRAAILNLVKLHTDAGRADAALALLLEGQALAPNYESQAAEQAFLQAHYFVHYLRGDVEHAEAAAEQLLGMARRVANRLILFESLLMVVDLYLHRARWSQAETLLTEARTMADSGQVQAMRGVLRAKAAWLALGHGDRTQARALLAGSAGQAPVDRHEDRGLLAWVGAAAALADGDAASALAALQGQAPDASLPTDVRAMLLVQHLHLAYCVGSRCRRRAPAGSGRAGRQHRAGAGGCAPAPSPGRNFQRLRNACCLSWVPSMWQGCRRDGEPGMDPQLLPSSAPDAFLLVVRRSGEGDAWQSDVIGLGSLESQAQHFNTLAALMRWLAALERQGSTGIR